MRIVGIFFEQAGAADTALEELRARPDMAEASIDTAPIAADEHDGTLIALSVDDAQQPEIERVAARHGGRVVVDVPTDWL
jgi:hypothetical protein